MRPHITLTKWLLEHKYMKDFWTARFMSVYTYFFSLAYLVHLLEKAMAPHSSTLAWKIPWTEEPGGLQSMRSLSVGHDWATSLSLLRIGEGNGNPLQYSCLENPKDGGDWWATVHRLAKSRTQLKRLSRQQTPIQKGRISGLWGRKLLSHSLPFPNV